jgi:hypothetical protein
MSLVGELWSGSFFDRTDHAPGAQHRGAHDPGCRALVLHRIGSPAQLPPPEVIAAMPEDERPGDEGRDVEAIIRFFTQSPAGVATVTLDGSYDSKRATIDKWTQQGVPADHLARAFVPYTFLINPEGEVHQMLPLQATGAHAIGYNQSGYGIGFIGDGRYEDPTPAQLDAGVAVCVAMLRQLKLAPAQVKLLGHDEAREAMGSGPKGCPGDHFPLAAVVDRIRSAAA